MAHRANLGGAAALLAMLFWFGFATAALACPTTLEAVIERSTADTDCCDQHTAKDCALPPCVPACTAIVAPQGSVTTAKPALAVLIWPDSTSVEGLSSGPEPPPPRTAEA